MAKKTTAAGPTYRDIISEIRKKDFHQVYLLMGEESYYLDKIVDALEECVVNEADKDFNYQQFYGAEADMDMVIGSAKQFPMMADRRLVILKEAQSLNQAKRTLEKLAPYVENPSPGTVFAVVYKGGNLDANSAIVKGAQKGEGVIFRSERLKEWALAGPIRDYCTSRKVGIDDSAIEMLTSLIGSDLNKLFGAIDKILVATGGSATRINTEMVGTHTAINKDFNNFEFRNAMSSKDYPKAMLILQQFAKSPGQNPTAPVSALLYGYFSQLCIAHFTRDKSDTALMEALSLKTPYALKEIRTGLRNYTPRAAMAAISALRDFDTRSKGINSFQNEFEIMKETIFRIFTIN